MDTSEQYIKMSDCEEIQEHMWRFGDYYIDKMEHIYIHSEAEMWLLHKCRDNDGGKMPIWLPRQDQLQEMVWDKLGDYCTNKISSLSWGVYSFYLHNEESPIPDSMEQLWLAFVLKERWNKTWDGEKWE